MSRWSKDAIERIIWTTLQAGAAVIVASQSLGVDVFKTAGIAALFALFKALAAKRFGDPDSAAF